MQVGFIGLGAMGARMARNVGGAGHDLRVYNRSEGPTEPFADDGIPVADSPREAAADADAVVVMVTDGDAVWDVLGGDDGALADLPEGALVINSSTIAPAETEAVAERVREAGGRFVDAPVSGTTPQAEAATLTVLAAGEERALADADPVLAAIGDPVVECGPVGQGTNAKLFVNLLLGTAMQGYAEALAFGASRDLDLDTMRTVVESGGLDAPLFEAKGGKVADGDYSPQFPVDLLFKDLNLILDAGGDSEVPLPATAATRESVNAARALGYGDEDMAAVVKYLESVADVNVAGE